MTRKKVLYNTYSDYLKRKYGSKTYKLPLNIPVTCPNRDGKLGEGGCIFCAEIGTGFESLAENLTVREQLVRNKDYIGKRYKAEKFIAYFQNFTNTYLPLESFKEYIYEALIEDVVEIAISTRPDCIGGDYLDFLEKIKLEHSVEISFELGLQTVNYHSLQKINRGHSLAEFIDAVLQIKKYGFEICCHLILNLPWDKGKDVVENAKIMSALGLDQVKLHALYIVENTVLGDMYKNGEIKLISAQEYKNRVIEFLQYLDPDIIIQRLIGRAPEENSLFVNWGMSWWKIRDEIHEQMRREGKYQGQKFNYLRGKALEF